MGMVFLLIEWLGIHRREGAWASLREFVRLVRRYRSPERHYHSLAHIIACLRFINRHYKHVWNIHVVKMAIFYHDAVYDIHSKTNEQDSANLFVDYDHRLTLNGEWKRNRFNDMFARKVYDLILLTAGHKLADPADCFGLGKYMIDTDMHVFGMNPVVYKKYAVGVWKEYSEYGPVQYRKGRLDFLLKLDWSTIFVTDEMKAIYASEKAAHNIANEIFLLEERPDEIMV